MEVTTFKWNNISLMTQQKFYQNMQEGKFSDCTISCEGKFITAHQIILSAGSKYFDQMSTMSAKHQMIVLQDVAYDDLVAIVKFVYTVSLLASIITFSNFLIILKGEANILSKNYERFMRTAKNLQIEGLGYDESTPQQDEPPKPSPTAGTTEYSDRHW